MSRAEPADASPLTVGGVTTRPGAVRRFEIPMARLPNGTWASLPVAVVHGRRAGPRVWLSAALHGDELNGVEIVRQVLRRLAPERLAGAVLAVPIVNVLGFVHQDRYLPDRRDLNRSFPGSARGSLAARLAHLFLSEVVSRCRYGVDLHTGSHRRANLPQVRADLGDPETRRCAEAFGARVMIDARTRDGSLREAATRRGAHVVLFEGGEALRFDPDVIRAGTDGVLRMLATLGMVDADGLPSAPVSLVAARTQWVRARSGGIAVLDVDNGASVARGDRIGTISDPLRLREVAVRAPFAGIVIGRTTNPLVYQGDALLHLAEPA